MRGCESSAAGACRNMKEKRRENGELIVFVQWSRPVVSMLQSWLHSHWVASRISWRLSEGWTIRASSSSSTLSILSSIFNNTASSRVFFCSTGRCRLFLLLLFRLIHFPRNTASEAGGNMKNVCIEYHHSQRSFLISAWESQIVFCRGSSREYIRV